MLDAYREGKIDRLFLVNAQFVNTMTQKPTRRAAAAGRAVDNDGAAGALGLHLRAGRAAILDGLLMRYIESQVYRGAVENVASEMAARMVAMKAATDNAGKLISELQLDLQQGTPGRDHERARGDRGRRGSGLSRFRQRHFHGYGQDHPDHRRRHRREFPREAIPQVYEALKLEGRRPHARGAAAARRRRGAHHRDGRLRRPEARPRGGRHRQAHQRAGGQGHARSHHGRARRPAGQPRPGRCARVRCPSTARRRRSTSRPAARTCWSRASR